MNRDPDAAADRVKSAGRVLDLIEMLAANPDGLSFSSLVALSGFPKSSLHALLAVLTARRYAEYDEATRLYALGERSWESGQSYLGRDIVAKSLPAMNAIANAINETVQLARLEGTENVYLAKVDSTHPLRLQSDVGARLSAHATGLGKALLASLPEAELRHRFPQRALRRMTPNTLSNTAELFRELAEVREFGFAVDNEEYTPGLFCLAVPIRNHADATVAAMSVSVPLTRTTLPLAAAALAHLARASVAVTGRIGGYAERSDLLKLQDEDAARRALLKRARNWAWLSPEPRRATHRS